MKIIRKSERSVSKGDTFTGDVSMERVLTPQVQGGLSLSVVNFKDGARTNWHVHPGEQVLYILEGEGRVGTADEEYEVQPGDVVHAAAGERHWHGAVAGKNMTHISVTNIGSPDWQESPEE